MSKTAREVIADARFAAGVSVAAPVLGASLGDGRAGVLIAALDDAGFEIVPKEPTAEMLKTAHTTWYWGNKDNWMGGHTDPEIVKPYFVSLYKAMIAAASKEFSG